MEIKLRIEADMSKGEIDRRSIERERALQQKIDYMRREWGLLNLRLVRLCQQLEMDIKTSHQILEWLGDCDVFCERFKGD